MAVAEDFQLFVITKAINELSPEDRAKVEQAAAAIRETVASFGDTGMAAMALVGAEIAAKEATPEPRMLIQDNDSHWYVIPVVRRDDFYQWETAMESCEDWPHDWEPQRVQGPHTVQFTEWKETT